MPRADAITRMLSEELLNGSELVRLRQSFATVRGDDWSEREERQLVHWARQVRVNAAMLKLVLSGVADFDVRDGEVRIVQKERQDG